TNQRIKLLRHAQSIDQMPSDGPHPHTRLPRIAASAQARSRGGALRDQRVGRRLPARPQLSGWMMQAITGLAEVAVAGWPLGLTLAAVAAGDRVREARRRASLNRALHELRRPVQSLVLASSADPGPGPHAIRVTLAALD